MARRALLPLALGLIIATVAAFFAYDLEPSFQEQPPVVRPSEEALSIHRRALVIDLHVDSLLWPRDLNEGGRGGHLDFPRMRRGGLDAGAFTTATRFFKLAGLKAFHDRWPPAAWFSSWARLRQQLFRMERFMEASAGKVRLATTPDTLRDHHRKNILSVFHGIEGAHALGTELCRVRELARAGVVFIAPVHLTDNEYGGSSSGSNRGLTELGRALVWEMNQNRVLVDLAHASRRTFEEALSLTTLPPVVSHVGARAVHDTWRNLDDEQIRTVAARQGVIGVMLAPPALSRPDLREAIQHLSHIVEVGGEDVAALGSDFDGYVEAPIDVAALPQLTELMLREGWREKRIRKILGENVLRVLSLRDEA
ncbi:MAG: dipeptidase [Acidobacteriota bacterium]